MRQLIQVLLFCVVATPMWGQYVHHYTNDNAGNRIQRHLVYWFTPEPESASMVNVQPKDSLKAVVAANLMTFKVYPNPNNGLFQVSTENYSEGAWLELFDASGRQIQKQQITESTTRVDITRAGAGMFVLICRDKTQILGRWKVVSEQ